LISTEELSALLADSNVRILDCSASMGRQPGDDQRINFLLSHIQGAQFLDLDYFRDLSSPLPFMMPTEKHFCDTMKRLDVGTNNAVVCYDTGSMGSFSYRAAWMLRAMGVPNVRVLNGGFAKWIAEGLPVQATNADAVPENFAYTLNSDAIKTFEQMQAFASNEAERTF
jgi:thiosulfate/3-mercaptopyruvate sulfurtransferase